MSGLRRSLLAAALLAATVPLSGAAPLAPPEVALRYRSDWGGLHTADMVLTAQKAPGAYDLRLHIRTRGAVGWLFGLDLVAESGGRGDESLEPLRYQYHALSPENENLVALRFDPDTGLGHRVTARKRTLPDGQWAADRPDEAPLAAALRTGVFDPLSAFLAFGEETRRAVAAGQTGFAVPVFDGRRRFDLAATIGTATPAGTIRLRMTVKPVAGFKKRHLDMWQDAAFDVEVDTRLWLPVRIVGDVAGPLLVIRAVQACPPAAGCVLTE